MSVTNKKFNQMEETTENKCDRCEWQTWRRATGDDAGWRGRATDDSSVSGASRKEPCPLALWFQESCADQAGHPT